MQEFIKCLQAYLKGEKLSKSLGYDMIDELFPVSNSAYKKAQICDKINDAIFKGYDKISAIDAICSMNAIPSVQFS